MLYVYPKEGVHAKIINTKGQIQWAIDNGMTWEYKGGFIAEYKQCVNSGLYIEGEYFVSYASNPLGRTLNILKIQTLEDAQISVEGIINDFEAGISTKEKTMALMGEYTAHIMDVFWGNAKKLIRSNPELLNVQKKQNY